MTIWVAQGGSHVGLVRRQNEDSFAMAEDIGCYLVADGLGGHAGGEVASAVAIEAALAVLRERPEALRDAMTAANNAVQQRARKDSGLTGMGTTLSILRLTETAAEIVHVGDSRIYAWSPDGLVQLTRDHTAGADLVEAGAMPLEQARRSGVWHQLTQAVGIEPVLRPQTADFPLEDTQSFLLCSDGVTDMLSDLRIADVLGDYVGEPDSAVEALIQKALAGGGEDNATALVVTRRG